MRILAKIPILIFLILICSYSYAWEIPFKDSLATTPDAFDLLKTIKWALESVAYIICIFLVITSARSFSKENYIAGTITFLASVVAGASMYLARIFI